MEQGKKPSMTLKQYITEKLRMLTEDFCMDLTESEIEHMKSLKTEIQVDNYARYLFEHNL